MDTDNDVVKARGLEGWVEGDKGGEMGGICNSVNQEKLKLKKESWYLLLSVKVML